MFLLFKGRSTAGKQLVIQANQRLSYPAGDWPAMLACPPETVYVSTCFGYPTERKAGRCVAEEGGGGSG